MDKFAAFFYVLFALEFLFFELLQ